MKIKYLFIPFVILIVLNSIGKELIAQNYIVFTSSAHNDSVHKFWRIRADLPVVLENISQKLDVIAPFSGNDYGPITVSHDGKWYSFKSDRFGVNAGAGAVLTVIDSSFSNYEVIHDSLGNVVYTEDAAYVLTGGNEIVFVAGSINHSKDIFIIHRNLNSWGMPKNLTIGSAYNFNYFPYVSSDGLKILFDAGNSSFPSTAIGEININGSSLSFPITASSMPIGIAAHSPSYGLYGSIIYEGDASGERIWKLPIGTLTPSIINSTFVDDNSPVCLPDGRIVSLYYSTGSNWHQLKIMNADGSNGYMLTDSSSLFTEVADIGISTTSLPYSSGIKEMTNSTLIKIFPNPLTSFSTLQINVANKINNADVYIYNSLGEKLFYVKMESSNLKIEKAVLSRGIYFVRVNFNNNQYMSKLIVE